MTKIKIALVAVLFAATSSAALATSFDPNLANRYPGYAEANTYGYAESGKLGSLHSAPVVTLQSAQVGLRKHGNILLQQRDVALPTGAAASNDWFEVERSDRASSPYAGGN